VRSPVSAASPIERFIGRSLAACVHPVAAWRLRSMSTRVQLVAGYAFGGYILVLTLLLLPI
jgi:hypothetical protein